MGVGENEMETAAAPQRFNFSPEGFAENAVNEWVVCCRGLCKQAGQQAYCWSYLVTRIENCPKAHCYVRCPPNDEATTDEHSHLKNKRKTRE